MPSREWPFLGDSPVAKARKVALAYRAVAEQQRDALLKAAYILGKVDRRLVAYTDPAVLGEIDGTLTAIANIVGEVGALDKRFRDWGEQWHAEVPVTYEEDDWISGKEAAPLISITPDSLGRLRIDGRIKGKWDPNIGSRGGWTYRVGDVWKLSTEKRGRGRWTRKEPTDSIGDKGRGDSK